MARCLDASDRGLSPAFLVTETAQDRGLSQASQDSPQLLHVAQGPKYGRSRPTWAPWLSPDLNSRLPQPFLVKVTH